MTAPKPTITIRELDGVSDLRLAQDLEKEVWNLADIDVLALTSAVATMEAGATWLGAFDDNKLAGFAFAFPGIFHQNVIFHSHQVGVRPQYRDLEIGYKLKLAQRDRVLAVRLQHSGRAVIEDRRTKSGYPYLQDRISEITWTFDPLQSKNAHFNFFKLGVLSDSYKIDLYGPATSSLLHRNGTDRLWVRWLIRGRRVGDRLAGKVPNLRSEVLDALSMIEPIVLFSGEGTPIRSDLTTALRRQRIVIEIPSDINSIEQKDPELAREWRNATQWAFTESLRAGFHVAEFCRTVRGQQGPGAYLLEKGPVFGQAPELSG